MCAISVLDDIKPLPQPCAANLLQADGSLYCKAVAQAVSKYLDQRESKALRGRITGMELDGLVFPKDVASMLDGIRGHWFEIYPDEGKDA